MKNIQYDKYTYDFVSTVSNNETFHTSILLPEYDTLQCSNIAIKSRCNRREIIYRSEASVYTIQLRIGDFEIDAIKIDPFYDFALV